MLVTDAYLGEHAVFYRLFGHMEDSVESWNRVELRVFARALFRTLVTHGESEDEFLLRALEPMLGTQPGPLHSMRHDHDEIERLLREAMAVADVKTARLRLREAVARARDHFAKEEKILFPAAIQKLGSEALKDLASHWAQEEKITLVS